MSDDRRAIIAEAMEASAAENTPEPIESKEPVEPVTKEPAEPVAKEPTEPVAKEPAEPVAKEPTESVAKEPTELSDAPAKAPQSWKPGAKAQWDKLPPEVRQEVARREHQTSVVLNESAMSRKVASEFQQAVQPYMARIQSQGVSPTAAVGELLKADYLLSTAPTTQRAQFMAKLISDYGVDLHALDAALSGVVTQQNDPQVQIQTQVQQLLQQQLAPYQSLLQEKQIREQQEQQNLVKTVESFENNPKYPYFGQVRQDMADLIELSARRNAPITIEQAYNRAIQSDPSLSAEVATQRESTLKAELAAKANAQAQRALKASISVGGAPTGNAGGPPAGSDRRSTIAAAFDSLGGR